MPLEIRRIGSAKARLGEGPVWDVAEQALYWVDALGRTIHRYHPESGRTNEWAVPGIIGSLALREGGGAILALEDGLYAFDFLTGKVTQLYALGENGVTRFNDGKVDPRGAFIAGTMTRSRDPRAEGAVYRLDVSGKVSQLDSGIAIFNGPCFSPDGRTFYFSDSLQQKIWSCDYDPRGVISNKRCFVDTTSLNGLPDGATIDAEGCLWSALVSIGMLARFSPDGELLETVRTPASYPTSVMFGGPSLDRLFVTSISDSLRFRAPKENDAGGLFEIKGIGAVGLPERRFRG